MSGLGDLLELMFTARRRYRTLRLVLRIWQDPEVAELLRRELVRRAEESPSSGMVIAVLSASESSDAEPVPAERIDRIWFSAPHRYRDVRGPQGAAPGMWSVIDGGWRTSRWDGEAALRQPVRGAEFWEQAFQEHRPLVDPSVLLSGVDLRITGRTEAIGRPAITVLATKRADVDPFTTRWHADGGDGQELVVDAGTGLLLRVTQSFHGRPYAITEVLEIGIDEEFGDGLFAAPAPPEPAPALVEGDGELAVLLTEAPALVPFTVLRPDHVRGTSLDVFVRTAERPHLWQRYGAFTSEFVVMNLTLHAERDAPGPPPGERRVDRDGLPMWVSDNGCEAIVRTVRRGTHALLQSHVLPLEELMRLAGTLRPV